MTTTFEIPDSLYQRAAQAAAQKQLSLNSFFAFVLEREVGSQPDAGRRMEQPPVKSRHPVAALTNAEIAALFDEEEQSKAR
jgi:site-specific recombinase XerD